MRVIFITRKRNPSFFSIELVFENIRHSWRREDVPTVWELPYGGISVLNLLYLFWKSRRAPSDTHFHITGDALYVALALPSKRVSFTIHDCVFTQQESRLKKWLLLKLSLDWPLRWCKCATAISDKTKSEVLALTGCSPDKIVVIPNPVSPWITYEPRVFQHECPRILFLGTTPNKNLSRSIEALKGLQVHLILIGRPSEEQILCLQSSGITYDICQGLSHEEVAKKYQESDMILFPSLYEGFGLPIIEAFKSGRPVITSNIPPMNMIAQDAACLVDPQSPESIREAVKRIIEDAAFREQIVAKGFQLVSAFDPKVIAGRYAEYFTHFSATC